MFLPWVTPPVLPVLLTNWKGFGDGMVMGSRGTGFLPVHIRDLIRPV